MWFKVDDKLWGSPKWLALGPGPRALWTSAGSWSGDQLTDGFIPAHVVPVLGGTNDDATALVTVGMWVKADGGYAFHDWSDYQVSRDVVLTKRETEAQRKADWRAKRASDQVSKASPAVVPVLSQRDNRVRPVVVPSVSQACPVLPDQTRPDQTSPKGEGGAAKRGTRIPDDFTATAAMAAWAKKDLPGVDSAWETQKFIDYWRGVTGAKAVKLDWAGTWRNWMRRSAEDANGRPARAAVSSTSGVDFNPWMRR